VFLSDLILDEKLIGSDSDINIFISGMLTHASPIDILRLRDIFETLCIFAVSMISKQ
jgi:hypothetical protein